jgi:pimeloyl-ACP methyl ester carboxylesterase
MSMVRCITAAVLLIVAGAPDAPAQSPNLSGFGIVLLHGKGGTPSNMIEALSEALRKESALVETPEMPWSARRIYDATYEQAMAEIDAAAERLKAAGAEKIVVAGHSLGANAAIGYGARRDALTAIIALAPGHAPESWALRLRAKNAVARAKDLVAAGQGDVMLSFPDLAQGIPFSVRTTPTIYLSMFDPDGPAPMPKNAAAMRPVPFLWVVGIADPIFFYGRDYAYDAAAKHPKSKYLVVPGLHVTTPFQTRGAVIEWLKSL